MEVCIAAEELRREILVLAQHIVDYQNLAIGLTSSDTDDRHLDAVNDLLGQRSRHFFDHTGEAACFFKEFSIAEEFGSFGFLASTNGIGAKLVDALRRQTEVPHDGNACFENALDGFDDFNAAFQFERIAARFLHDADGIAHAFRGIHLIGAEGHIADNQSALGSTGHRACVVNHLVKGDGQCGVIACHHVGCTVAYEDDVDARSINDGGCGIVVGGEHGNLLALFLHFN